MFHPSRSIPSCVIDITLVFLVSYWYWQTKTNLDKAIVFNDEMFNTSVCNSRGTWNATEHYNQGDCVVFAENNCIYLRHDDSVDSRHLAASFEHQWIPGGPSLKHYNYFACIPRNLSPVKPHEISWYMHLIPMYYGIGNQCSNSNYVFRLYRWIGNIFYTQEITIHTCIVDYLGSVVLSHNCETYQENYSYHPSERDVFITHSMMESNSCDNISQEFVSSVNLLTLEFFILTIILGGLVIVYTTTLRELDREQGRSIDYRMISMFLRWVLIHVASHTYNRLIVGIPHLKMVFVYGHICNKNPFMLISIGVVTYLILYLCALLLDWYPILVSSVLQAKNPVTVLVSSADVHNPPKKAVVVTKEQKKVQKQE